MRIAIIVLCLSFNNFFAQDDELIEKLSLECLYNSFSESGLDIKQELERYEDFLIENEFLEDKSGDSYIKFYKKVFEINYLPATRPNSLFLKIINSDFQHNYNKNCFTAKMLLKGEFKSYTNSKDSKVFLLLNSMTNSSKTENMSFKGYASIILDVLNKNDLEKPFYKTLLLLSIALGSNEEGHEQFTKLPPPKEN
ncbi:hypothetical protein [Aquimarina sp. MMG016]|uniref:hypothetical protein n=1 Tax=Aquimarina sp. MMG016 TaxID=2822690 RepID=UPI001B3A36C2|nr:hypothetical protein [Aquimarina sp. MMG016]MBQ4821508.1 hypothetical protein [Aquimarina sp. MMG016]